MPTEPTPGGSSLEPDDVAVTDAARAHHAEDAGRETPDGDERYPLWQRILDAVLQAWP